MKNRLFLTAIEMLSQAQILVKAEVSQPSPGPSL